MIRRAAAIESRLQIIFWVKQHCGPGGRDAGARYSGRPPTTILGLVIRPALLKAFQKEHWHFAKRSPSSIATFLPNLDGLRAMDPMKKLRIPRNLTDS